MTDEQKSAMLADIDADYQVFCAFMDSLTDEQLTTPTDAAGWTPKDHIMHCAIWAKGISGVIEKKPRWEVMGVSEADWETVVATYDVVNEAIHQLHLDKTPDEVKQAFRDAHETLMGQVASMSVEDLSRPYDYYQPWVLSIKKPLYGYVMGNTGHHYMEHKGYIEAILAD